MLLWVLFLYLFRRYGLFLIIIQIHIILGLSLLYGIGLLSTVVWLFLFITVYWWGDSCSESCTLSSEGSFIG